MRAAFALLCAALVASLLLWSEGWQEGVVEGPASPWLNVPGPLFALLDAVALAVNLAALAIAFSAWRRAASPLLRRQMKLYVVGFGGYDAAFVGLFVVILHTVPATGDIFAPPELLVALAPFALATTLWLAAWLGYGILSAQLFDIDLRLQRGVRHSTVAAAFVAVFFVASEGAQLLLSESLGPLVGLAAAGLRVFALAPLQRLGESVGQAALPGVRDTAEYRLVRKREVYRAALEGALHDGSISERERDILARLQDQLGLSATEARALEREAGGSPPGLYRNPCSPARPPCRMAKKGIEHEARGKVERGVGKAKEGVGRATGNRSMEARGKAEAAKGGLRERYGKVKRGFE